MNKRVLKTRAWVLGSALAGVLLKSAPAFACATCYTDAIGPKALEAIKSGILILLLPTVVIFGGVIWVTFRYRDSDTSWQTAGGEFVSPDSMVVSHQGPPLS
jgi:hypothetical protein